MLSDFLAALLGIAASPLLIWLAVVGLIVLVAMEFCLATRTEPTPSRRPADGEPYDWKEHGL